MRLQQLTFSRFLAAMAIVIYHEQSNIFPFDIPLLHSIFSKANVGVSYFFILSGYVMVIAYNKNISKKINTTSYYINRIARIYPIYIFALILTFVLTIKNHEVLFFDFIAQLIGIQAWIPSTLDKLNYPGWSLSVELFFYIIFPLSSNYFFSKYSFRIICVITIGFWLVSQVLVNYWHLSSLKYEMSPANHILLFYSPLVHINEFLIGNFAGFVFLRIKHKQGNFDMITILLFVLLLTVIALNNTLLFHDGLLALLFVPFILTLSLNNGMISTMFSNKYLILLGEASYGLYILQVPIRLLFNSIFKRMHIYNHAFVFYAYLISLVLISVACYFLIEIPAKNLIKNMLDRNQGKKQDALPPSDNVNF